VVAIEVQGQLGTGVTKPRLYRLDIDSCRQTSGGRGVPEIMRAPTARGLRSVDRPAPVAEADPSALRSRE
jgi:hypothetical protein